MKQFIVLWLILLLLTACQIDSTTGLLTLVTNPTPTLTPTERESEPAGSTPTLPLPADQSTATATNTPRPTFTPIAPPSATPTPTPIPTPHIQRLTQGTCCVDHYWGGNNAIRFIDQNPITGETGIWEIELSDENYSPQFVTDRLGTYSPNRRYLAYPDQTTGLAVIEDLTTNAIWQLDLNQSPVNFTPDSEHILWLETDRNQPFETRVPTFWLMNVDGSNRRQLGALGRVSVLAWLDDSTLLLSLFETEDGSSRFALKQATIATFSITNQVLTPRFTIERPRGVNLNPSKTGMTYFIALADDPANNGIWYVDLTAPQPEPRRLPFFGSYKWRDDRTLIYIPFNPDAESHFFYSLDVLSGQTHQLTDAGQPQLTITNNDWSISPDGSKIVLLASKDLALDGLWLIELVP